MAVNPSFKKAIIIGAGPAGLTAAFELLKRTDIIPIIIEKTGDIGGISKTVKYKGNRMDIGGHRFFSKSDRVMQWWLQIMPLQETGEDELTITYQNKERKLNATAFRETDTDKDNVMLVRSRLSRIYFLRRFFSYPLKFSVDTLGKLGLVRSCHIILSYLNARINPVKPEKNLEDFFINKFGRKLYRTFFKDYTEKVWGIDCKKISPEWGAQRIKGVSISKTVKHAIRQSFKPKEGNLSQKDTETSLIEKFLYPKYGPGQLWEEVAGQVKTMGGSLIPNTSVSKIICKGDNINAVEITNKVSGSKEVIEADYVFSSMPVKELVEKMDCNVPSEVRQVAEGLMYRDFITVGVLLKKLCLNKHAAEKNGNILHDNWIYIQERDVKVGRLQIFNNWSPFMVSDPNTVWLGMEYFCNEGDELWVMDEEHFKTFAIKELEKIGLIKQSDVLDATVVKVEKAYPAYFGTYDNFDIVKNYTDKFANLYLIGRNGMHKYNNSDHSMLTAMTSVDNICNGIEDKSNIWGINTEQEYHEESTESNVVSD